ncbi:PdaC/SigV domain-containing protein [Novosphingobium colocasiae]
MDPGSGPDGCVLRRRHCALGGRQHGCGNRNRRCRARTRSATGTGGGCGQGRGEERPPGILVRLSGRGGGDPRAQGAARQAARRRPQRSDRYRARRQQERQDRRLSLQPPHYYDATWQVVTDLPDWLSLSAEIATYTGGAHGMAVPDTLLWDKSAGAARQPLDLFTSKEALRSATQSAFCAALDKERAKRRGAPVDRASGEMFTECIDPVAQTVILGSSNHRTFDRIGFLIAPYEAGPYAEGSYEVTLPVSDKVMAALKPQYRGAFSVLR